jgi:hypothetical protein
VDDGKEPFQDRQEDTPENHGKGQTLPLRQVPEAKPEARQDAGPVVLPQMLQPEYGSGIGPRLAPFRNVRQRLQHVWLNLLNP